MVVAQKVKEAEITEQDSLLLTRNLLRIAVFNISYIRGLFPEKYFNDKNVPALEMNIKKLMPMDAESRRLIDWMEKGVYDALQKKYLKTLLFCICESIDGPMIEEYTFSFSYSRSDTQDVLMNINRSGNKKGGTFKCNSETEVTPAQMRSSACKMVRTLIQLMRTLDKMPEERTILMKLFYYDDVTPADYEPPFFRGCTPEETQNQWTKNPLKMEVGNVNSKHFALALKVKSILDPCDEDSDDIHHDNDVSLGDDSIRGDGSSDSDSEVNFSPNNQADQYRVEIIENKQPRKEGTSPRAENSQQSDDTQDIAEDERQLSRVKDWISSCQNETLEATDVLANFPDISVVLIEEIMNKLVKDGVLVKTGRGSFGIRKQMEFNYEFHVKEEDDQISPAGCRTPQGAGGDHMYMKALYYALPMEYVTVAKLQHKLEGEANRTTVRKLMEKMARDGFIEARSNRRLGKRVIHSDLTEKKLSEVKKVLKMDPMDEDLTQPQNKLNHTQAHKTVKNNLDGSTCGALHSIGSDLTRTKDKSYTNRNEQLRNLQTVPEKDVPTTPISKAGPVASRESMIPGNDKGRTNIDNLNGDEVDNVVCSGRSTQEKRCRKLSMVREPILQYVKRQKSQAAC